MSAPEQVVKQLDEALAAARKEESWPQLSLPDAIEELSHWLDDERQWARTSPHNWTSLIDDAIEGIDAFGPEVRRTTEGQGLCDQLEQCRALLNKKETRSDPALRQRLRRLVGMIREQFRRSEVLLAAWDDLTHRVEESDAAERSARQLFALAAWIGHDPKGLSEAVGNHLSGSLARAADEPAPAPADRLATARDLFSKPPSRARMIIWLRFIFARVLPGWIDIGPTVRIYRGEWLRSALEASEPHNELPPEATTDGVWLRMFCQQRDDLPDERERPVAYVRIDVGDEFLSRAVGVARDTAQALASLGSLYGAEPTLWRLDESYVCYSDDQYCGGLSGPPVAESATFQERIGVLRDRTAEGLEELADRLGTHLPVRDPGVHAAVTLLGWLREARTSPPPLRLVLFDRLVETACGWAGIQSTTRFVRDSLIPWWAYSRIRNAIESAGFAIAWGGSLGGVVAGSPEHAAWQEILKHPPLEIGLGERRSFNLKGLLTETQWLIERLPANSDAARQITKLARRTAKGQATAAWWDQLCKEALRIEARRLRTRNALVHGGPLAPATVEAVAGFAEHLAGEALAACIEGRLLGNDLIDYFLDRDHRIADIRARLKQGAKPSEALFWQE
jgi:predicted ATPase